MGSVPTDKNNAAQAANAIIKGSGATVLEVVETLIIADVPWLGLPVVKQIWERLLMWVGDYFFRAAQTGVTFAIIDHQINSEEGALTLALANLIAAKKSGDGDAIKKAIQNYADAQSRLTHSDGSASPK